MKHRRLRSARNDQGDRERPSSIDVISQMPDDLLVMILCLLSFKDALATSSLSSRWRFLWCSLNKLDFDGNRVLEKMDNCKDLLVSEQVKFVTQVNSAILQHNHPTVQDFQIRFDLDRTYFREIDKWIQFELNKKVENLVLNLKSLHNERDLAENYIFRLPLGDESNLHLFKWPSLNDMVVEISLQKLDLLGVNVSEPTLNDIIKSCPHLENLRLYGACLFSHIHVGGQGINLKHFKLVDCEEVESIFLYDFNLVSFQYIGPEIELYITDLPKLKELDIGRVSVGLENNVFHQIESCASYLQVLYLETKDCPEEGLIANAIPKLPNVKKLYLTIGAEEDDCLLEFTAIAQACPSLETLEFSLIWLSPIKKRKKVRHVAAHPHEHLKLLKFHGYFGRISDLELVAYVIANAVNLRKIVIDPCCHAYGENVTAEDLLKQEQAARSCAKRQITSILPRGVELAICSVGVCGLYV